MAVIKTPEEIEKLKLSGKLLSQCLNLLVENTIPGKTAEYIDILAETFIRDNGAIPAFKGYPGQAAPFPSSICFSPNQTVVHGIPRKNYIIKEKDLITIDCGLYLDGWCADAARLFSVGEPFKEDAQLIEASRSALAAGIAACKVGNKIGDISNAIQKAIILSDFFNVIHFCGHAIGKEMHESPQVPNFGRANTGITLEPGMVFCLEPVLKKYKDTKLAIYPDGWTIVTSDNSRASHIEHMVLITEGLPEVLTI